MLLVIVNVAVVMPFKGIIVGEKVFVRKGGIKTDNCAVAGSPGPASVEVGTEVWLSFKPSTEPVTWTSN